MLRSLLSLRRLRVLMASCVALAVAVVAGVLLVGQSSGADETSPLEATSPIVELPARLGGAQAIKELGGTEGEGLEKVAQAYDMTPEGLAASLERDQSLRIDTSGRLFYADDFGGGHDHGRDEDHDHGLEHEPEHSGAPLVEAEPDLAGIPDEDAVVPGAEGYSSSGVEGAFASPQKIAPLDETFELNSHPNPRGPIVYLDFDGHEFVAGDMWGLAGQQAKAWDPAHDGPGFSDAELIRVQQIWARVAEHFSFAEINVTTQEPPAALFREGADRQYALRVLVSPNIHTVDVEKTVVVGGVPTAVVETEVRVDPADADQPPGGTIGLAYLGTAVRGPLRLYRETPALVFAGRMNGMSDAQFASTISHEAGHNFNYSHTFNTSTYQAVRPIGADSSAVHHLIMDYAAPNGSGFFTAEERSNLFTANSERRPIPFPAGAGNEDLDAADGKVKGWLTGNAPADTFLLTSCDGNVRVKAVVGAVGPTLDVGLKVQEGATWSPVAANIAESAPNTTVGSALRNDGVDAEITFTADPATTYVVQVATTGSGTSAHYPAAYTYGQYTGSVEGCGAPVAAPSAPIDLKADLELSGGRLTGAALVSWDAPMHSRGEQPSYEVAVDGRRVRSVDASTFSHRIASLPEAGLGLRVRAVNSAGASPWVAARTPSLVAPKAPAHVSVTRFAVAKRYADGTPVLNPDGSPVPEWRALLNVVHHRDYEPSSAPNTAAFYVPAAEEGYYGRYNLTSNQTRVQFLAADLPVGASVMYEIKQPGHPGVQTWVTVRDHMTAPTQVRNLTATLVGSDLDVTWKRPVDDGGAWLKYAVRVNGGAWVEADRFDLAHSFEGLTPAPEYLVEVKAHHAYGSSVTSVVVPSGVPGVVPASRPRAVEIIEDSRGATLRWEDPARLHGRSVSSWRVTIGAQVVDVPAGTRQLALTGFRAERTLQVTVAAVTSDGTSTVVGAAKTVSLAPAE